MASRKRISFQWRLFLPFIAIIWLMVIAVGMWSYYTERISRIKQIRSQIDLISAQILSAYNDDVDPAHFLRFIGRYYIDNPLYDQIRVSAYYDGELIHKVGPQIMLTDKEQLKARGLSSLPADAYTKGADENDFYYDVSQSDDGRLMVYTVLPFDSDVRDAVRGPYSFYFFLLAVAVAATLLAYVTSRRLGHDISMLRTFAIRAGYDADFVPSMDFSRDELGDIYRQLVRFYNERKATLIKIQREHSVALHALEDKARLKRELTINVNHELKTPVGVIKGYIDTIREHPGMDEASRQHFLDKAREHVDRLVQMMNDLSTITRLEYGAQMINLEPVNFHEIVFQLVSDYGTSGVLGGMTFNYDVPTYCRVIGSEPLLTTIINNLTKNAVHYSQGTECNLILTGQDEAFYQFAFYDNGVGVKKSSLPHIFDRFFREDSGRSRKKGGTGLGLSIVQNSIEALGGTISAANRDGGGLLFRFTLRKASAKNETDD